MSADASPGRQVHLSELECDERKALLEESLLRPYEPLIWNDLRRQFADRVVELLQAPWFQELTLEEVQALDSLPLWNWLSLIESFPSDRGGTQLALVKWHLLTLMDELFDDPSDLLTTAVFHDETYLLTTIRALRETAAAYGLDLLQVAEQAGWTTSGS